MIRGTMGKRRCRQAALVDSMLETDFFAEGDLSPLPLDDAEILYTPELNLTLGKAEVLHRLIEETPWSQETITLFGKTHLQPRLTAWYGDDQAIYSYSGKRYQPLPWTALLTQLRRSVEAAVGADFNSVLLNYYRDGADSMGLHADDEPELGPQPCIASLSLGETRTLYFKHKFRKDLKPCNLALESGSLLVMQGTTQQYWKHGIRKVSRHCEARVNLTFRQIIPTA